MLAKKHNSPSSLFVASLAKGMTVLEVFSCGKSQLGITEISRLTGFEKSLTQRLVNTLYEIDYLGKDINTRKYYIKPKILTHSFNYLRNSPFLSQATPRIIELRDDLKRGVNLCVLNDTDIVYITRLWMKYYHEGSLFGESLPAYCSSGGRVMLGCLDDETVQDILTRTERKQITAYTKTNVDELMTVIKRSRNDGYAWQVSEYIEKEISVSAPIQAMDGRPIGAVIVTGLLHEVTDESCKMFLNEVLSRLLATCSSLSKMAVV